MPDFDIPETEKIKVVCSAGGMDTSGEVSKKITSREK